MRTALKINIPEPCHEDWDKMTPQDKGRHCASCQKTVFDFTTATDEHIVKTFQSEGKLCGRFKSTQLNRELVLSRKEKNNYLSCVASTLFTFLSFGTQDFGAQGEPKTVKVDSAKQQTVRGKIATSLFKQKAIVGTVTTKDHLPLNGVAVSIKGTERTTQTDSNGHYKIKVAIGDTLVFSNVGYQTKEQTISTKSTINVSMILAEQLKNTLIKGTVISANDNLPLPGASVIVKGTTRGAQTDFDGNYVIEASKDETLVFSYVGCKTNEHTVGTNTTIDIAMANDELVEGIVIVGGIGSYDWNVSPPSTRSYNDTPYSTKEAYDTYKEKLKVRYQTYRKFYKRKREERREKIKNGDIERTSVGKLLHNIGSIFRSKE